MDSVMLIVLYANGYFTNKTLKITSALRKYIRISSTLFRNEYFTLKNYLIKNDT